MLAFRTTGLCITIIFPLASAASAGETTSEAMHIFGLIGKWSEDCANPKAGRVTYAAPTIGPATSTAEFEVKPNGSDKSYAIEVIREISASRVTEDKLRIITTAISQSLDGVDQPITAKSREYYMLGNRESILLKVGAKIKVIESHAPGGQPTYISNGYLYRFDPSNVSAPWQPTDKQVDPIERCLN